MRFFIVVAGSSSLFVAGCAVSSDELSTDDAYRVYVAPMLCTKQSQCVDPGVFDAVYPGGVEECKTKVLNSVADRKNALSGCTNDEYKRCRADYEGAQCPSDPKAGGLPPKPASCNSCAL